MRKKQTRYFTSAAVAKILGLDKRTLHNHIKAGKLPMPDVDPSNGYFRWTEGDIAAIRAIKQAEEEEKHAR